MWAHYINATTIEQALYLMRNAEKPVKLIAGGTDIMLELERRQHPDTLTLVDISRIEGLHHIHLDDNGQIHIGALVTHNDVVASPLLWMKALPLVLACREVGSPQIRNRGTIVGNLVTASPANDAITPLMALDAFLTVRSQRGTRIIPLCDFYQGVRSTHLETDEMVVEIVFKGLIPSQYGIYRKTALRRAQAISVVNVCTILDMEVDRVVKAAITLGAVAPTIIHAYEAEKYLEGKPLTKLVIEKAAELASVSVSPISDIRSSMDYRKKMVLVSTKRVLTAISAREGLQIPTEKPVFLKTTVPTNLKSKDSGEISVRINGKEHLFVNIPPKSLLHLLREDAQLTGTKEGCSEGECGACTVFMDGMAVMSCLVPAPRAHGTNITTIEGLGSADRLTPLQQAFIDCGAVQCGYCTPGFIMSSTMLLEEIPDPSKNQIQQALAGNLCRCTGYYKIIEAVQKAAEMKRSY